jgi:hypothetical protein
LLFTPHSHVRCNIATVRKLSSGKWNAQVRRKGHTTASKSFIKKEDALIWIRSIESDMDKGVHINRTAADNTTLAEALVRYRTEITPHKKGSRQEFRRIATWLEHPLAKRSLSSLKSMDFVKHSDRLHENVASNNVSFRRNLPLKRGVLHEKETVRCGADCGGIEGSGGWHAGGGADSSDWHYRADILPLEEAIRWPDSDQARQLKQLQEENERLKKIVAELSLDKAMLADVIKKKW